MNGQKEAYENKNSHLLFPSNRQGSQFYLAHRQTKVLICFFRWQYLSIIVHLTVFIYNITYSISIEYGHLLYLLISFFMLFVMDDGKLKEVSIIPTVMSCNAKYCRHFLTHSLFDHFICLCNLRFNIFYILHSFNCMVCDSFISTFSQRNYQRILSWLYV